MIQVFSRRMWAGAVPLLLACTGTHQHRATEGEAYPTPLRQESEGRRVATRQDEKRLTVPSILRVILVEVLVAPVKSDGRLWDMGTAESETAIKAMDSFASITATSGSPVALGVKAVTSSLPAIAKGSAWPDVYGEARMSAALSGDGKSELRAHAKDDALVQLRGPSGGEVSWLILLSKSPRLQVSLLDRDVAHDDAIGVFVISERDFEAAWRDGEKYWVRVTEQTNNQVLAVGIIVEEVK